MPVLLCARIAVVATGGAPAPPSARHRRGAAAESLARAFERSLPRLAPVLELPGLAGAIGALVAPIRRVELAALLHDDKVRIDGDLLVVDHHYPDLIAVKARIDRRLQRLSLFVGHEVAHLAQGIGDKRRVSELHAADGEETLLQIDLEADHAAAVFVRAVTGEELAALKRDELASLSDFPVKLDHFPGARERKARRAVALAIDIAARDRRLVASDAEFAFLHWTRGGGPASLFVQGAYRRLAGRIDLSPSEAALLDAAANPGPHRRLGVAADRIAAQLR
ncbi:MAG: hypothetical protein EXR72_19010 [Myxococcales bacterium]|nr:hypothetical protein [Myxococcales bacterium]